ncbi:MAG: NRDE family protein [Verrucomicrobia bacterium]|nr:NRDE family protein [Verrucomicrobiota bacterium]MDA1066866.1 NRDE family protein [Verrucomicrobiota bacterium]
MCTVSWCIQDNGYTLFFNRDESRQRELAQPPKEGESKETKFLSPKDPQGGGTWLLVNEHGISMGLLNYYDAEVFYKPTHPQSRGYLPLKFSNCSSLAEIEMALNKEDFSPYPPLHFLSIEASGKAMLLTWDGKETYSSYLKASDLPISTSSFKTDEVIAARRSHFAKTVAEAEDQIGALETFHMSAQPEPSTHSALMTRPDARTISVCRIDVSESTVSMDYRARPDDTVQLNPSIIVTLPRS